MNQTSANSNYPGTEIEKMFSAIAHKYDLINHLASIGLDFSWRKRAAKLVQVNKSDTLIDFCCGTGDFAFAFANKDNPPAEMLGCDFSQKMLNLFFRKKTKFPNPLIKFSLLKCDCTAIPIKENTFNIAICAFGLRNIPDFRAALKEMLRVLKPGGQVCILEFSLPKCLFFGSLYRFYFCHILPRAAGILSGQPSAYKHLSDSVCQWHNAVDLVKELEKVGFSQVTATPLTLSIAVVFTAKK